MENIMNPNFCCLCASDEGVFLDIFTSRLKYRHLGNRSFVRELETCLSLKVDREEALSTTICHRCAVELGQCKQFVDECNQTYDASLQQKKTDVKKSCCFCLTAASNNYLFTLAKDFRSSVHPLQKIYECFNRRITRKEAEWRSICLECRYNLDVLYDLKKLAREVKTKLQKIAESKAILASLPKTETFVVNRKTTVICQSKLELEDLSNSASEDKMPRKRSRSKKIANSRPVAVALKLHTCGQCQTSVEGGIDMYRPHRTGVTVCKMCWITMDPCNNEGNNKRRRTNQADVKNTRLCTVLLKDVLADSESLKEKKESPKVDKNEETEPIYVISDDTDEDSDQPLVKFSRNPRNRRSSKARSSEGEHDSNSTLRAKRSLKPEESDGGSKKKLKSGKNEAVATVPSSLRRSARYQSSDSDNVRRKSKERNLSKPEKVDSGEKLSKKELKKNGDRSKRERVKSKSEDPSSSNDDVGRTSKKVRNKVPIVILETESLRNSPKVEKSVKKGEEGTTPVLCKGHAVSKNLTVRSIDKNKPSSKAKHSSKRSKNLMTVSFPFKIRDRYKCKVCGTEYRNKIIGMTHELTHQKQVEIKMEKLNVTHHFQTTDQNSRTTNLLDASCSLDSSSTNEKQTTAQLEEPASNKDLDSGKEEEESLCPSVKSDSVHDIETCGAISSTNGLPAKESISSTPEESSKSKTAENVSTDLGAESVDKFKKIVGSGEEVDSVTETNIIDSNGTAEEEIDTVDENGDKEAAEEVEKTANSKKNEESIVLPSSSDKDVGGDKESGEEMESDTDIRIVDSGSSGEDSDQRCEKVANDEKIVDNVSGPTKPVDLEDDLKPDDDKTETLNNDKVEDESVSKINSLAAEEESLQNGEAGDKGEPSKLDSVENELSKKTEEDVTARSAVTEILQEVMDLASAEVRKRSDSGVAFLPETLENISEEIKKTGEESAAAAGKADVEAAMDKEVESIELDSNTSINIL